MQKELDNFIHNMKNTIFIYFIVFIFCYNVHSQNVIKIPCFKKEAAIPSAVTWAVSNEKKIDEVRKKVPPSILGYHLLSFDMDDNQGLYERLVNKTLSKRDSLLLPTLKLYEVCKHPIKHEIHFIVAFEKDRQVVIPDINNNMNFLDDPIIYLDIKNKKKYQSIPIINGQDNIENNEITATYEVFENNSILSKFIDFEVQPSFNDTYSIVLKCNEHREATVNIDSLCYRFRIVPYMTELNRYSQYCAFSYYKCTEKIPKKFKIMTNDSAIHIGNNYYRLDMSKWGDTLTLTESTKNFHIDNIEKELKNYIATTLDNKKTPLLSFDGSKYTLIDFWGTWCGPCRITTPKLVRLREKYSENNLRIIGVASDKSSNTVKNYIKKNGISWTNFIEDSEIYKKNSIIQLIKIWSYPTFILLDPKGKVLLIENSISSFNRIEEKLNIYLDKKR